MPLRSFTGLLLAVCLSGCNQQQPQTPEQVALTLFHALYVEHDLRQAKAQLSAELLAQFEQHQLPSQIQRNLFALPLEQVSVSVADVEADFFRKNSEQVRVLIRLDGIQGLNTISDDRWVKLQMLEQRWVVTQLYEDPLGNRS
ncbi:hypothetical protein [Ferrimonas senticii]|uniref:hypothetical protein n=1 Tax=Ferrimonas senticii TaxID=394566 RepID=UPI00048A0E12|nr:hypothetical protein [Ferrimonas senticii]